MAEPIETARIRRGPEVVESPFPYQIAPPSAVRGRRLILFTLTGVTAYCLTLIATLPARLLLDRADEPGIWLAVSGTVWSGEAALAHGHGVRWTWAPLASLANLAFTTNLQVIGADTELKGEVSWRPSGIVVTELNGTASATLVSALAPSLPFLCDFPMRVNIDRLAFGGDRPGAAGEIMGSAGSCAPRNSSVAASTPVPPLAAEGAINVGGSTGWVAPRGNRSEKLITFAVTPSGETSITVSPAASAVLPGADAIRALAE